MLRGIVAGAAVALVAQVAAGGAAAQDVSSGEETGGATRSLETEAIVVTGGRTPVGVGEIGRAYTIITGEELERRGVRYVADALRSVPGLAVSRTGSAGGFTQLRVRGSEANQVLVLIDGVEVAQPASGEFDLGALMVADIERIEVLRGPQSALWGANAAAGVVSIITRRGRRGTLERGARFETGTDGTLAGLGFIRGGGGSWDASVSAAYRRASGFDVSTAGDGEKDGDRNLTLNAKATWDLGEDVTLGASAHVIDRASETDTQFFFGPGVGLVFDSDSRIEDTNAAFALFGDWRTFDDALTHTLRFEFTDTDTASIDSGVTTFRTRGNRLHGSYQASLAFGTDRVGHRITGAVELERETNEATTGRQTRDIVGFVGEYRGTFFDVLDLQAGIRHDVNDAFRDATTFSVGASLHVAAGTRLHGSIGRGVTNPTFVEQFGFFPGSFVGNPDLKPERIFEWDVGVEQRLFDDRLVLDVTYFRGKLTDEIVFGFDPVAMLPTSVNAPGKSRRQGVEVSATLRPVEPLAITATYTYTDAEDGLSGQPEVRRPRHQGSLDATLSLLGGRASLSLGATYTGRQKDFDFTTGSFPAPLTALDDFVLVNLAASYRVSERVELFARVENLTDTDYEEVFKFSTQGITAFAGLRLSF